MEITREKTDKVLILKIDGRIDAVESARFESEVNAVVKEGEKKLAVDLSGLDYINSSGLRSFLDLAKNVKKSGGSLVIFSLRPNIREIFDMTGFSKILNLAEGREEALETTGS